MKLLKLPLLAIALWSWAGAARAIPILWSDFYDPADILVNANATSPAGREVAFTLDIRPGSEGFRPGIDSISTAKLTIWLYDDLDLNSERVSFNYDGSGWTPSESVNGLFFFPDLFQTSPIRFLADGILDVVVRATQGDFRFDRANLIAVGERNAVAVPEPATSAIFGLGLLAMGFGLRRLRLRQTR